MAPSTTIGATILLCRRVLHSPQGTRPINSMPRGPRPLSRAILVLTAVSSINTSRAGSSMPCSRIQRRRARATSARCCSAARKLFFEGDVVSIEETPQRAQARANPSFAQRQNYLLQGQVRLLGDQRQYLHRVLLQRRSTSSARLRRTPPSLVPALHPSHCRTRTDFKTFGRLAPGRACCHCFDHALSQVARIGLRHRHAPHGESNARRLAHL